jgi:Protein of unknown function (DUF4230)
MFKKYMIGLWIVLGAIVGIWLYKILFTNSSSIIPGGSLGMLFIGLMIGAAVVALFKYKGFFNSKPDTVVSSSTIMLNKIERVFKVVSAEGHFSEVYDYSQTTNFASFIPSTKKALLLVNAKVLMGFDFKKCKMSFDEDTKKMTILEFPKPEVLSIESDIKYYNVENGLFNKFDNNDLTKLQQEAKTKILGKVAESELPKIAQSQMQNLISELKEINQWQLQGAEKILMLPEVKN